MIWLFEMDTGKIMFFFTFRRRRGRSGLFTQDFIWLSDFFGRNLIRH